MTPDPATLLLFFGRLSLLAVGGANATVPEMHRLIVEQNAWMDDAAFVQLYALSASAPGPNILFVSALGWHLAGPAGMAASTLGILAPAWAIAWGVAGLVQRLAHDPRLKAVQGGLVPVAIGLALATGLVMADAAAGDGWPWLPLLITGATTLFVWRSRFSPLWALAAGGVLGLLLGR